MYKTPSDLNVLTFRRIDNRRFRVFDRYGLYFEIVSWAAWPAYRVAREAEGWRFEEAINGRQQKGRNTLPHSAYA